MKTAVSLPDDLFEETDAMAAELRISRSRVVSNALREYIDRHTPDRITAAMNSVVSDVEDVPDQFVQYAAHAVLRRSEW